MVKACNFDNVMGKLLGMRETDGLPVDMSLLDELDASGKARYNDTVTQWGSEVFDDALPREADRAALKGAGQWLTGDSLNVAKHVFQDLRNPSGLFGEEMVRPVVDFITDHHAQYFDDIPGGKQAYMDEIGLVFDDVDTSGLSPTLQDAWNKYRQFYENGGELYTLNQRSGIEKGLSNLAGNIVKSSPTVIVGNVMEGTIKLPTLYPKTFMQGMAEAWQQGITKKIPELEQKGVYGLNYAGESADGWAGLIGLTDVPLKNIAYFAGKAADGDGLRAVQRVAFTPRFGDLPGVYYSGGGRLAVQLLSYTINSYKMYNSLWKEAIRNKNIGPLVTYHVLAGAIGGGAMTGFPKMYEEAIKFVVPESESFFEENKGPLTKLIQPGNVNRIFVAGDIAGSQVRGVGKNLESARDRFMDGDIFNGILDSADALMGIMAFGDGAVGDLNVQKALKIGKEVVQGELEFEDIPDAAAEAWPNIADPAQGLMDLVSGE